MVAKAKRLIPAAGYIRRSSGKQEKSFPEQKVELKKLAAREGCEVVEWFQDDAISGDTGSDERQGLASLLVAVEAGRFGAVLAWHTNRLSRQDSMDAVEFYNRLRKARVRVVTCCEGHIDLQDFSKQLLMFVNQKANHDYNVELSAKVLRGQLANAKGGNWNGGNAAYAMDRVLCDQHGREVRRLAARELVHLPGHRVRLAPCKDQNKVEAVRYAFQRFVEADVGYRNLAYELDERGYPSPGGCGWTHSNVRRMLEEPRVHRRGRLGPYRGGQVPHVSRRRDCHRQHQRQVLREGGRRSDARHGSPQGHRGAGAVRTRAAEDSRAATAARAP